MVPEQVIGPFCGTFPVGGRRELVYDLGYVPEVTPLLARAAAAGCETAFHNLGVLMEEQGDAEQAKAFFSRGR